MYCGFVLVLATLLIPVSMLWSQSSPARTGSALAAPDVYRLPDGSPADFYVEAFQEAARREGVVIFWNFFTTSVDDAIASGKFDLVAGVFPTPERRFRTYLTEAWWNVPILFRRSLR